ncbi:hypothetical protein ACOME3_005026 [Neoechinorhynchus agilis]
MHIKKVILDGFKSYPQRTEIGPFDEHFNAITGLNGTGKSNILDGICFTLGMASTTQMRAQNLRDLIYKHGTGGVESAAVTVVFDMSEVKDRPFAYKHLNELSITRMVDTRGQSKLTIAGSVVTNKVLWETLASQGMDTNNPHFLVMQGQIVKVLGMKPLDVLRLIDTTAGTSVYNSKKDIVMRVIERKDTKLSEITTLMSENIGPELGRIQKDRQVFDELQEVEREIAKVERKVMLGRYVTANEELSNVQIEVEKVDERLKSIRDEKPGILNEIEKCKREKESMRMKETNDDKYKEASEIVRKALKSQCQAESKVSSLKNTIETELENLRSIEEECAIVCGKMDAQSKPYEKVCSDLDATETVYNQLMEEVRRCENARKAAKTGQVVDSDDGSIVTLNAYLLKLKTQLNEIEKIRARLQTRLQRLNENIDVNMTKKRRSSLRPEELRGRLVALESSLKEVSERLNQIDRDNPLSAKELTCELGELRREASSLESKLDSSYEFRYDNPEPGFDRTQRVYGPIISLFQVKEHNKFARAIETIAKARLFNVVVDRMETAKLLLKRGGLRGRVTFVPLDTIQPRCLSDRVIKTAEEECGGQVWPAVQLVHVDDLRLAGVMEWVFGSSFVCSDLATANKIAFDRRIGSFAVTLDGDEANPAGILSGGSVNRNHELCLDAEMRRFPLRKRLCDVQNRIAKLDNDLSKRQQCDQLRMELEKKRSDIEVELADIRNRIEFSEEEVIARLQKELKECKNEFDEVTNRRLDLVKRVQEAENGLIGESSEADLKRLINEKTKVGEKLEQIRSSRDALRVEIEVHRIQLESMETDKQKIKETMECAKVGLKEAIAELEKRQLYYKQARSQVDEIEATKTAQNQKLSSLIVCIDNLMKKRKNCETAEHETELELVRLKEDLDAKKEFVRRFLKSNKWVLEELEKADLDEIKITFREMVNLEKDLSRRHSELQKIVDLKSIHLLEDREREYRELTFRKDVVISDRNKITGMVSSWDYYRVDAVTRCWRKVNEDFGKIFSSLLKGATAELYIPGRGILLDDGLGIRVGFEGRWKDSLQELSGGQRSLAALSLILAMLRYNPAPVYFLDEIDAALDLAHTENIGKMIRTFFKDAQFIVVSLKNGMFENANVLLKTCFKDGISSVKRTARSQ